MATVLSNLKQTPEKILTDLINAENNTNFTTGDLSFGFPAVLTGDPDSDTTVMLDPTAASRKAGWVFVNYNRINFNELAAIGARSFFIHPNLTRLRHLVSKWDAKWNVSLINRDFIDKPIPILSSTTSVDVVLEAGSDSLVYNGAVTLALLPAVALGGQVGQTLLSGLNLTSADPIETADAKILLLMGTANPGAAYAFDATNIALSNHQVSIGAGYNTQITATGINDSGYYGEVTLRYNRIDLTGITNYLGVITEEPMTMEKIAQAFRSAFTSFLRADDLVTIIFNPVENGVVKNVTFTALSTSRGWIGARTMQYVTGIPTTHDPLDVFLNTTYPSYYA